MKCEETKSTGSKKCSRREFLKTTALGAVGVSAAGFLGTSWPSKAMAQPGAGVINVVTASDADSFDPHTWLAGGARMVGEHVFEGLLSRDGKPVLATSWENPDKLTWIFHLKKGVQFHNGATFDADAVKFTVERILDPNTKSAYASTLRPVEAVEALDKHTVRMRTTAPYPILPAVLGETQMVSPKAIADAGKDVVRKPVGTGPFVMKQWIPSERIILEANPSYHGQKPNLKSIIWRPVAEAASRIVELTSGRADVIEKVPPELAQEVTGPGIKIQRVQSLFRHVIMLNLEKPPFNNLKIRQALNYAVNKEHLIQFILNGAGTPMGCLIGPTLEGYNPDLKPYPFDPARAKMLLAEAGYPNGVEAEILCPSGRYLKDKEIMEALAFQAKEAGFNLKLTVQEWGMFLKNFKSRDGFFIGDETAVPHRMLSRNFDSRQKQYSWFGYHSDEMNKWLDEASETFDASARNAIMQKIGKKVHDEAPYVFLYYGHEIYGVRDRVKDMAILPMGYLRFHNASAV